MTINVNQKNTFGDNEVNSKSKVSVIKKHGVGFAAGVLTTLVAEFLIRSFF